MNDRERNYYNTFVRIRDFGAANNDAIKNNAAAVSNLALVAAGVDAIEASGEVQSSGGVSQGVMRKELALADLRASMRAINRTARSLAVDDPAIAELFRMPHGSNEQQTLAAARAFLSNAAPIAQQFIGYGLPAAFLSELESDIDDYEQAITEKNTAMDEGVGSKANIAATVKETLKAVRRLRGIVPNLFAGNSAKLAEWRSASHVEKPPKSTGTAGGNPAPNLQG